MSGGTPLHSRPSMNTRSNRDASSSRGGAKNAGRRTARSAKPRRPRMTAATSDRHDLYERSVQTPEAEVAFIDKVWRRLRGRTAESFREDFAGTMYLSTTWVRKRPTNTAIAVDLDPEVQQWGIRRHVEPLKPDARRRLDIRLDDVRTVRCPKVDCIGAFNFSYSLFKERAELVAYFRSARKGLKPGGIFLLDAYGGSDSYLEQSEDRKLEGFTYVWDTERYNPITGEVLNHIHFRFPDGTAIEKAFSYDWRLWGLAEIQDCLHDAGFGKVEVYWEGTTEDGDGDGNFKPTRKGDACLGWIAYLSACD
jgi:SAM-dependent methyltransferase